MAVFVFFLAGLISVAFGCSCDHREPREKFCFSEFVGVVTTFATEALKDGTTVYATAVNRIFKSSDRLALPVIEVVTDSLEEKCGLPHLKNATQYLLNGNAVVAPIKTELIKYALQIDSCSQLSTEPWDHIPHDIKKALENESYKPC
ncbi:hypothetical protein QR680_010024 [Steinernema hermaphroditum]|uniref:NTR domain-containing protein n=1 Tax=Steinernema hermaphroditum TaxID=289476 RepID=A0AA39MB04_9BILA|nr:hypothetical protein QR680_010024 [Steinernema hermaphroditum]